MRRIATTGKSAGKKAMGGMTSFFIVMLIAMGAYSIPPVRDAIGVGANYIFGPMASIIGVTNNPQLWVIMILILASITGCYSSLLQKYTIDYEKMQAVQAKMKEFQKIYREAQLAGDEKKLKKLNDKRARMMEEQMQMSQEQFKPMGWILIVTVPIFIWLLWSMSDLQAAFDAGTIAALPTITFPYIGEVAINAVAFFLPSWILWYMICSICLSQVIRKALNIGGL
ncbi:DUF106 domain-containing protein [Methanogenium organophilum]|uniref:EMC3/TMCO1 family protein n=1 Tax=Methanogenium organophilum TaxID=2199 RepID=A0A9X9T985_METOG|nr:EMC3/TMCO1 family protein [Methanogenium organophilum]WAI01872.1 EMC3/TMCO1 family protein [Methanogenium organophilum]